MRLLAERLDCFPVALSRYGNAASSHVSGDVTVGNFVEMVDLTRVGAAVRGLQHVMEDGDGQ